MSESEQISYDVNELLIYDFFEYWPSLALACVALSLFTVAALIVGWLTERRKMHRFVHCITATGLLEAAGYAALIYAIKQSGKSSVFNAYVVMQVFVIEAPNILQAGLYITVGKILSYSPGIVRGRKILRGWVVTTCFTCADLAAIIVQAAGISIWASSQSSGTPDQAQIRLGCGITLAGLAVQLIFFFCFTALVIWTHRHPENGLRARPETRKLYRCIYLAMSGLFVRNVFRFVEFTQNTVLEWPAPDGTYVLAEQQVLFYTLDALPILLAFVPFIIYHPGHLLPQEPPLPFGAKAAADDAADAAEGGSHDGSDAFMPSKEAKAQGAAQQGQQAQQFQVVSL